MAATPFITSCGGDDCFTITLTADLALLPNLRKITLFYDKQEALAAQFITKGIDAEYV